MTWMRPRSREVATSSPVGARCGEGRIPASCPACGALGVGRGESQPTQWTRFSVPGVWSLGVIPGGRLCGCPLYRWGNRGSGRYISRKLGVKLHFGLGVSGRHASLSVIKRSQHVLLGRWGTHTHTHSHTTLKSKKTLKGEEQRQATEVPPGTVLSGMILGSVLVPHRPGWVPIKQPGSSGGCKQKVVPQLSGSLSPRPGKQKPSNTGSRLRATSLLLATENLGRPLCPHAAPPTPRLSGGGLDSRPQQAITGHLNI